MRLKEATNKLASFISSLNLESEEMAIEEYVQLARKETVNAKYNMVELVDLAWDREVYSGLELNEKPT